MLQNYFDFYPAQHLTGQLVLWNSNLFFWLKSSDQNILKRFSTGIGLPPLLSALPWNSHLRPLGLALIHFRLRIGRRLSWSEYKIWNICTAAGASGG